MERRFSPLEERMKAYRAIKGLVDAGWTGPQSELVSTLVSEGIRIPSRATLRRWVAGDTSPFTNVLQLDASRSDSLSFYLGGWLGDGWGDTSDGGARMRLKVRSQSFAGEFAAATNSLLSRRRPYRVWTTEDDGGRWYNVKVTSVELYGLATQPFDLLKQSIRSPARFLRGFFTAEGCPVTSLAARNGPKALSRLVRL